MRYWSVGKQIAGAAVDLEATRRLWGCRRACCRPSDQWNVVKRGMNIADLSLDSVGGGRKKLRA